MNCVKFISIIIVIMFIIIQLKQSLIFLFWSWDIKCSNNIYTISNEIFIAYSKNDQECDCEFTVVTIICTKSGQVSGRISGIRPILVSGRISGIRRWLTGRISGIRLSGQALFCRISGIRLSGKITIRCIPSLNTLANSETH